MSNVLLEYIDLLNLWQHKQIEILGRAACTRNYYSILVLNVVSHTSSPLWSFPINNFCS